MALSRTDLLIGAYLAFVTIIVLIRGPSTDPGYPWILVMHGLFALLFWLFTRRRARGVTGRTLHVIYPLLVLVPVYTVIGMLNDAVGLERIVANDALVQSWEEALFGKQLSHTLIRRYPSVFWSGLLHFAYFFYYPAILLGPLFVVYRHGLAVARPVIFATMLAYVTCYAVFVLFPVAGPNYVFPHPTGPVREVWSADLVYGVLAEGSSVGAAFPSSHVAATVAVVWAIWRAWRGLAAVMLVPTGLMTIATVYCQMHYTVDAAAGLLIGLAAGAGAQWLWDVWPSVETAVESPVISASLPRTSRV